MGETCEGNITPKCLLSIGLMYYWQKPINLYYYGKIIFVVPTHDMYVIEKHIFRSKDTNG